jgi:pilus assembly protein Flp/PilA
MKNIFIRLYNDESAATAVEYAIIAALVGVASIFAVSQFGDAIQALFTEATDAVNNRN